MAEWAVESALVVHQAELYPFGRTTALNRSQVRHDQPPTQAVWHEVCKATPQMALCDSHYWWAPKGQQSGHALLGAQFGINAPLGAFIRLVDSCGASSSYTTRSLDFLLMLFSIALCP